ncbi:MAG: hypothetical protein JRH17_13265 [Deltaproteobacteria bacterium]|nr:hypothetical protein [Deltaproteobacteria bacterium]MBW2696181.1 hypothetical protein [Deltaproteobacteria bacterium]
MPGGRLSGEVGPQDVPDWDFVADRMTAQLETRPTDPYSVNTWFVALGTNLYVPTSMIRGPKNPSERSWVSHIEENAVVRIRLGERVYGRVAGRVYDSAEYERVRDALEVKYKLDRSKRDSEREVWIFRLDVQSD